MEQINYDSILEIDKRYGTPFYLMDTDAYVSNLNSFKKAFLSRYDKIVVGYSFKTNYVIGLCEEARNQDCYAEVVSEMEYVLAKKIGFSKVIFNGPIKKEEILLTALEDSAIINLDSEYEIDTILTYRREHPESEIKVGLRINIDLIDEFGVSKVQNGLRVGRFGFTHKMLEWVIPTLKKHNIKIISLHGHTSSSDREVVNYKLITDQMLFLCEKYDLKDLSYFDVGGGFFGAAAKGIDASNKPKYVDYANQILDIVLSNNWFNSVRPNIVIEPGVSVVANVFSYYSKIFQKKEIAGKMFLTTDGTVFDVKPTLHSNNLPHTFITRESSDDTMTVDLVGSTCMEKDVILHNVQAPNTACHGDYIKIDGVGAYTIALTPTFINYLSPILAIRNDTIDVVRRRQTIDDIISIYG